MSVSRSVLRGGRAEGRFPDPVLALGRSAVLASVAPCRSTASPTAVSTRPPLRGPLCRSFSSKDSGVEVHVNSPSLTHKGHCMFFSMKVSFN